MKHLNPLKLLTAGMLLTSSLFAAEPPARPEVPLDGAWEFRMDPQREGEAGKWFDAGVPYPDKIQVPGNWQAQGFGEQVRLIRHNYQGIAWYRRSLDVPKDWEGKRVWLRFQGVCNNGEAYVNGQPVGRIETFITPYEFDVTEHIRFGRMNSVVVRVDSGSTPEIARNNMVLGDPNSTNGYVGMIQYWAKWGGLTGHVRLEARPPKAIDELVILSDLKNRSAKVSFALAGKSSEPIKADHVIVEVTPVGPGAEPHRVESAFTPGDGRVDVSVPLPDLRPWTPEDPFLYDVRVTVSQGGKVVDQVVERTGFREFAVTDNGGAFLLNGKPYFLRGIGYDSIEPITGTPLPDKRVYVERLRQIKDYGFNCVRFLGHTPFREFFEAADEVGVLVQSEGEWFVGNLPMSEKTAGLLAGQVPRIVREHRNHPSWYAFSCLNEFVSVAGDHKWDYVREAHRLFKEMDTTRFFLSSDGGDTFPSDVISSAHVMFKAELATPPQQIFNGGLDELAYFPAALSAESMAGLARAGNPADYAARMQALAPSGYWPLEEEAVGAVRDASGSGHDGLHEPGTLPASLGQPGAVGRALQSGAVGGVSLETAAPTMTTAGAAPFSVSLWARPAGFGKENFGVLFSRGAATDGAALILSLDGERGDGGLMVGLYNQNILHSDAKLKPDQWTHIGLTYDGQRLQLYVDGKPDAGADLALNVSPADLRLGRLIQGGGIGTKEYQNRPHIYHEFDNTYIAPIPDLSLEKEARMTGVMSQKEVIERHRARLQELGLLDRYPDLRERSIRHYTEYVKQTFEAARQRPRLDGYHWWLISDVPAGFEADITDSGFFDQLYQPDKFRDPKPIRRFNRESVLLIDRDINQRVLSSAHRAEVAVSISHYGSEPVRDGELSWRLSDGTKTVAEGSMKDLSAEVGKITPLGKLEFGPLNLDRPARLTLSVQLKSGAVEQDNEWKFWVFPERKAGLKTQGVANRTGEPLLDKRYGLTGTGNLADSPVVIATEMTPELLEHATQGGRVILLESDPKMAANTRPKVNLGYAMPPLPSPLKPDRNFFFYWARWIRCTANVVESHPALGDFPHDGFCDFQLMRLFGEAVQATDLSSADSVARRKFRPIIWGIGSDDPPKQGPYLTVQLSKNGLLSEAKIGRGRVLVCNLWVLDGIRQGLPEAGYLLDCLVDYMLSDKPAPGDLPTLTADEARTAFIKLRTDYTCPTPPSPTYPDTGGRKLTDGAHASSPIYTDPAWVGFDLLEGKNPAVVTLDLGMVMPVTGVKLSFLSRNRDGIYAPETFAVSLSRDGKQFEPAQEFVTTPEERQQGSEAASAANRNLNGMARYVRVSVGHPTGGGRTSNGQWLFLDEISVTTDAMK